jgi:1-acyl-sn-glycerol-3-phosphate acyltransferase
MTDSPSRARTGAQRTKPRPPSARRSAASAGAASTGAAADAKGGAAPSTGTAGTTDAATPARANGRRQSRAALNGHAGTEGRSNGRRANGVPWTPPVTPEPETASPPVPVDDHEPDIWDERVAGALRFLRRRITGQYDVDEFGFDPDLTETVVHPVLRLIYRHYFRVEAFGVENLPTDGSALIVANHSGTVPIDALMLTAAVHDETPDRRHLRLLGADLVFRLPFLSEVARKAGSTLACNPDAERLLRNGEYVGVFPEGFKGIGKPYRERYKLQRFGRGGFVSAALRTGAPIVPVAIVGAEEIYPIIANVRPLAKVTGLPYVPVTPLFPWLGPLGLLPLPSKWLIQFGKPIDTSTLTEDADDPIVVFNLADQVRETIQESLHELLERRPDPFT